MNFFESLFCFSRQRRRRKSQCFILFILFIFLCSSIEFYLTSDDLLQINSEENAPNHFQNRYDENRFIIEKYEKEPFQIDVSTIIDESNRKYFNKTLNRYLIYSCPFMCGGWGDRTRKIVAAFLLSLSLNRTFLLDMTWPCSIEEILKPNFISWSISSHQHVKNLSSSVRIQTLSSKNFEKLKFYHENYSIIYIETMNIAYFDLIARHDELHRSLFNRFRIRQEQIHILTLYPLFYQLLIDLKPHLKEKLTRLNFNSYSKDVLQSDTNPLICGHLRIGRNPSNPKDAIFPHREKMNITVLNFLRSRPGRVFITTDSSDVQQLAKKFFSSDKKHSNRLVEINGTIAHIDRDVRYLACQSLEKTILDFHALSYCQLAVISKSSFGHLAIMRRQNPYEDLFLYCNGIKQIRNANDYNQFKYASC